MKRLDILNDVDYMFETELSSNEVLQSIFNLINEFIDEYGIQDECDAMWIDCNESTFWTNAPSDYILISWTDELSPEENFPKYLIFEDGNNICILNLEETFGTGIKGLEQWNELQYNEDALSPLEPYIQKISVRNPDECANAVAKLFGNEYGENIQLQDIEDEYSEEVDESVKLDTVESKFETNDLSKSKLVGELMDDPDEDEDEKQFKRRLKKLGYTGQQQGNEQGGGPGGMFGESQIFKGKALRIFEYEYAKKEPQPMDIVEFQGDEAQVQAINPDGTMTLLLHGMTVDGVTKRQVKVLSYADLSTPLQFGKFDRFGNPDFTTNPWDDKVSKFHDLNKVKVGLKVKDKLYNESYAVFNDIVLKNKYVRILNEDMESVELMPLEDVEIVHSDIDEWPYAVIVIDQTDEEPQRKIKVNPVSYCNAKTDDEDVEILMNPSSNSKPTALKKKFIRILT